MRSIRPLGNHMWHPDQKCEVRKKTDCKLMFYVVYVCLNEVNEQKDVDLKCKVQKNLKLSWKEAIANVDATPKGAFLFAWPHLDTFAIASLVLFV